MPPSNTRTFKLGTASQRELRGVHPDLVAVVERAIQLTVQDFAVHDGTRTLAEQKEYVARGVSQTLDSRHLSGHAVDLVPYVNGKLRWELEPICHIADAVRIAARELNVPVRWGGAWDIAFSTSTEPTDELVADYIARRRRAGRKPFVDGPHYELPQDLYPNPA